MPGWFTPVAATLSVVALGCLIGMWTRRQRKYAVALAITAALFAVALLIALFWPTDQRRIEGALKEMAAGVKERNPDKVFSHVSESFRLGGLDKSGFRRFAEPMITRGDVTDVEMWDFEQAEVSRPGRTATIEFMVKPKGPITGSDAFYRCRATFALDPDEHWRLRTFQVFNPAGDAQTPLEIPGLPR